MDIELIENRHIDKNLFIGFNRYQETKRIYYQEENKLKIKDEYYVEVWDEEAIDNIVNILNYYIDNLGVIITVKVEGKLIGFAALNGTMLGTNHQYLNLGFIHVSYGHRGFGIGKLLFDNVCTVARNKGAQKLYIGANPAVDTYMFYQAVGCIMANEIVPEVYNHEPCDLQLEYIL